MIIPPRKNIEKIFRIYRNECAFHECYQKIIESDNSVSGNIIFIQSNKKDHPRFNPNITDEEMSDFLNLILFCDAHILEVDVEKERFPASSLKEKLLLDIKTKGEGKFELTDTMFQRFMQHFMTYNDPDYLSHLHTHHPLYDTSGGDWFDIVTCDPVYIKPKRHLPNGLFEIIDTRRKIQESDKVFFYSKSKKSEYQAEIKIKNQTRLEGIVPNCPQGEYLIRITSIDGKSKLEEELDFTVL